MSYTKNMEPQDFAAALDRLGKVWNLPADATGDQVAYAAIRRILILEQRLDAVEQCLHMAYGHKAERWQDCDNPGCRLTQWIMDGGAEQPDTSSH